MSYIHTEKAQMVTVFLPDGRTRASSSSVPKSLPVPEQDTLLFQTYDKGRAQRLQRPHRGLSAVSQEWGAANVLHKWPDGEYCRLCRPQPLHPLLILPWWLESSHRQYVNRCDVPVFQQKQALFVLFTKTGCRTDLALGSKFADLWPRTIESSETFIENADSERLACI